MPKKAILDAKELHSFVQLLECRKEDNYVILNNIVLGNIAIPYGTFGDISDANKSKGGYGIEHIIQSRYEKNDISAREISAILICVIEAVKCGIVVKLTPFKCTLEYRGIRAILVRDYRFSTNNWVLTGFPIVKGSKLKKETIDFISSVSERYKYLPEFSQFQTEVGAIVSLINSIRKKFK